MPAADAPAGALKAGSPALRPGGGDRAAGV
jgi:hypothetical protein